MVDLLYLFCVWDGGMFFYGGLIGVIVVMIIFVCCIKCFFFQVFDFIVLFILFGFGVGCLGNFINGELWGCVDLNFLFVMLFFGFCIEDILLL